MSDVQWIRSHVERLLQDEWGVCRVTVDGDGDYPWRHGTAAGWVGVIDAGDRAMVRVWAYATLGVKRSAKLLTELNDIQLSCTAASVMLANSTVIVSQTISPIGLTRPVLGQALESVSHVADDIGGLLAALFGGDTPYPVEASESQDAA